MKSSLRVRSYHKMFAAVPAVMGLSAVLSVGCAVDVDPEAVESVDQAGMSYEEFLKLVYKEPDSDVYIVNGDEAIEGERKLRAFYEANFQPGALIVHTVGGADAKWSDAQKLNLTYCVSDTFGANKAAAVSAMTAAAGAWEAVANVNFTHVTAQDASCTASNNNVLFDVRPVNSGGQYLARAFFPDSTRSSRNVLIDNSAFGNVNPWTLTGILRHELGHTLGFRHEHTRPEAGTCFEDNNWRALTTYDGSSVMHYPQCNGTQTGDLVITTKDATGAASLYGGSGGGGEPPPPPPPACAHDKCVTGSALSAASCGAAVQAVCAADAYCCTTSWDSTCVTEVRTIGKSLTCAESKGSCSHTLCSTGTKLANNCDSAKANCATKIYAADKFCFNNSWDSLCVGQVASVCGNNCN
jgi:hypothetical protein